MSEVPKLTPRLAAAADMVRPGGVAADIGTDHAFLPVYLTGSGICTGAYACDINAGPLERAKRTVEQYGAGGKVSLLLCDGLAGVPYADDVLIAGMGGELIARILAPCAFVKNPGVALVLQPMTAVPELRGWLCRAGFTIQKETVAREGAKLYVVMAAAYTGIITAPDEYFCLTGLLPQCGGPLAGEYLLRAAGKLRKKAQGLRRSADRSGQAQAVDAMAEKIERAARLCGEDAKDEKGK